MNVEVARRFDSSIVPLSCFVNTQERTKDEKFRLGHRLVTFASIIRYNTQR